MPTIESTSAWLLSVMLSTVPPGKLVRPAAAVETPEEGRARYAQVARTIAEVAFDPAEAPIFRMNGGREQTAALLLAVAFYESSWRRDVDLGIGPSAFGDHGRSCGMWQAHIGKGTTLEGWTCADLLADRKKAVRAALAQMRRSANACRRKPITEWLNVYASGTCERGAKESRLRVGKALEWFEKRPRADQGETPNPT